MHPLILPSLPTYLLVASATPPRATNSASNETTFANVIRGRKRASIWSPPIGPLGNAKPDHAAGQSRGRKIVLDRSGIERIVRYGEKRLRFDGKQKPALRMQLMVQPGEPD